MFRFCDLQNLQINLFYAITPLLILKSQRENMNPFLAKIYTLCVKNKSTNQIGGGGIS